MTIVACGKCLSCRMGHGDFLCEFVRPDPRHVARHPYSHGEVTLQYAKRRKWLGWQVWNEGVLDGEYGHFNEAWEHTLRLIFTPEPCKK